MAILPVLPPQEWTPVMTVDPDDMLFLLQFAPAMKDIPDQNRFLRICSEVHDALNPKELVPADLPAANPVKVAPLGQPFGVPFMDNKVTGLVTEFVFHAPGVPTATYWRIDQTVLNGTNKVTCIKFVREMTGKGLVEAKNVVDAHGWVPVASCHGEYAATSVLSQMANMVSLVLQFHEGVPA